MEHNIVNHLSRESKIRLTRDQEQKIFDFATLIHKNNIKFNLTGLKTIEDIIKYLILGSIYPIIGLDVPCGTTFTDIGSGSGIPGIPLGIYNYNFSGILVESNEKKNKFISMAIDKLNIANISALCSRIEDVGQDSLYRERSEWVFSRALGNIYLTLELGAPLAAIGGYLYIYSNQKPADIDISVLYHARGLGLILIDNNIVNEYLISSGLIFRKEFRTDSKFPRRFSVIKRESNKYNYLL